MARRKLIPAFTAQVLRDLLTSQESRRLMEARTALEQMGLIGPYAPIAEVLEQAYSVLLEVYPAEYVLLNESLCMEASGCAGPLSAFRELPIAGCKADLATFSRARSCGFEIKSRFDRLDRLQDQLQTYRQVFTHTYVVTDRIHVPRVLADSPVSSGVVAVSRDGVQEVRPAMERPDLIRRDRLFSLLRKAEYLQLIRAEFGAVPELPNTQIYRACLQQFMRLDGTRARDLITEILLRRQLRPPREKDRAWQLPHCLRTLALTTNLGQSELLDLSLALER